MLDVFGIGFGPANLAFAIAAQEEGTLRVEFAERQERFGWHRGMLLGGATLQVSFLKDLATMRNPTSDFSFVTYLHRRGRLADFINHKTLYPTRVEFHDYLSWAAERLDHLVTYGVEVTEIRPEVVGDVIEHFTVVLRDGTGREETRQARNVVVATGLRPRLPDGMRASARVWHTSAFLERVRTIPADAARVVVVGAGQSAAEVTEYLHTHFPRTEVVGVTSRYGYSPADDSPFVNRIFDPAAVDDFYDAPEHTKRMLMEYHRGTNYSVVDLDLINELYRRAYSEKVDGVQRLRLLGASRVVAVHDGPSGAHVVVEHLTTGGRSELDADAVVFATGYRAFEPEDLLGAAAELCVRDSHGRVKVSRDYRLELSLDAAGGIYLQGGTEHTHGLSSSLLSTAAVRAGEILTAVGPPVPAQSIPVVHSGR